MNQEGSIKVWLSNFLETLRATFWIIPAVMVLGSVLLSLSLVSIDEAWKETLHSVDLPWLYTRGTEGSRLILSTLAGSMITIVTLIFSMTIVTLQLTSSQFGPRLIREFAKDRSNQLVLGSYIATFTYCLLVLRAIPGSENEMDVPQLSVAVGVLLALGTMGFLIYFIHHVIYLIQPETVITNVTHEIIEAGNRIFPEKDKEPPHLEVSDEQISGAFRDDYALILVKESNYVLAIDIDDLLRQAAKHNFFAAIQVRAGEFLLKGAVLAHVSPALTLTDEVKESIHSSFYFGKRRTPTQDIEFILEQLVSIAVRALSPGINDPFTAISCIDRLGEAISRIEERSLPPTLHLDEDGAVRLQVKIITVQDCMDIAFNQIREAAHGNSSVSIHLLETIHKVMKIHPESPNRTYLLHHAELSFESTQEGLILDTDKKRAQSQYMNMLEEMGDVF